ncbi:MAG: spondin domain-containing protein [Candidatus Thiodiazotropha sp. (ex Dulcina madagascariensis)]|nr:spondin domain-containing protein [Candidatus Thiodiazotropha sp. (ex Epidulcina cf. delphinae)]MCU7923142.1 spondin domain-containing protein [Candidatus Thiodiazotropha sp. (ex Dulcina madagascariensis)]MCU7926770.1 spondin domain-containing protein [Candidatus Thiodiazotropha sp. (ex Dulcina madagascariensis)]MCU7935725.1 spondin domain-containing protein [Candidatus Thiodiazotropha sp. (ex Dulcina madagascariensis)]
MKKTLASLLVSAGLLTSASLAASDRDISVEITNLTHAIYFTPLLVAAHDRNTHLFQLSAPASDSLQAMAEGGDLSGLINDLQASGGEYVVDPAVGLLAPGASANASIDRHGKRTRYLSLVGMLLPTNDGFVGLDGLRIPKKKGTYTYFLYGYDAATEANDEIITGGGAPDTPGIPADPGDNAGVGAIANVAPDHNRTVHLHRGVIGDSDPLGGESDLDARVHRWQGPVARLVVRVGEKDD